MRGSRKRKGGWVPGEGVPQHPKARRGMLLSGLWARVHNAGRASWSMCNSGACQAEWYFEDVVQGLVPSLG